MTVKLFKILLLIKHKIIKNRKMQVTLGRTVSSGKTVEASLITMTPIKKNVVHLHR